MTKVVKLKTLAERNREDVIATLEDALEIARSESDMVGVAVSMVRDDNSACVMRSTTKNLISLIGAIRYSEHLACVRLEERNEDIDE